MSVMKKLVLLLLAFAPLFFVSAPTGAQWNNTPPGCPALNPCNLNAQTAGANILNLTDPGIVNSGGHGSDAFATMNIGFGPPSFTSPSELLFKNNLYGQNVIAVENTNPQGFSSYIIRGDDGVEHSALGCPNTGNTTFIQPGRICAWEISHYDGNVPGLTTGTVTASITTTDMNVTAITSGTLSANMTCWQAAFGTIANNTQIVSQTSGTPGGIGHYLVNISQTLGSGTVTCGFPPPNFFLAQTGNINGTNTTGVKRMEIFGAPYGQAGFAGGHVSFFNDTAQEMLGINPGTNIVDVNTKLEVGNGNSAVTMSAQVVDLFGGICMGNSTSGRGSSACTDTLNINDTSASIRLKNSTTNGAALRITNTGTSAASIIKFVDSDNSSVLPFQIPLDGKAIVVIGGAGLTVATLPACSATNKGGQTYVTDATAPTYLGALIGGGVVVAPVFCNGTAWVSD
jgi:hypothetical protein